MMPALRDSMLVSSVVALAFVGCNAILDNQPATVELTAERGDRPDAGATVSARGGSDSGAASPADAGDDGSTACPTGQQSCFGSCVSRTDPLYGCGDPTCAPCRSSHGAMGCQGRACVVLDCDPGYADCNASPADGCETDLSRATSCGACNAVCGAAAPVCAPSGATFQCTNGCTPAAPLRCDAECVDPNTSTNRCGGCSIKCPAVTNAAETCVAGVCGFTCNPQFHACAGACIAATDPTACGPACTACPVPANATATCAAGACGFTCLAGFGNCDAKDANGCEANLATSATSCGTCGKACVAPLKCVASVCR